MWRLYAAAKVELFAVGTKLEDLQTIGY